MKLLKPKLNPQPTLASLDSLLNSLLKLSLLESSKLKYFYSHNVERKVTHLYWSGRESGVQIPDSRCSIQINTSDNIFDGQRKFSMTSKCSPKWIWELTGEFFIIVYPNSIDKSSCCISSFFFFFFNYWFLLQNKLWNWKSSHCIVVFEKS